MGGNGAVRSQEIWAEDGISEGRIVSREALCPPQHQTDRVNHALSSHESAKFKEKRIKSCVGADRKGNQTVKSDCATWDGRCLSKVEI